MFGKGFPFLNSGGFYSRGNSFPLILCEDVVSVVLVDNWNGLWPTHSILNLAMATGIC